MLLITEEVHGTKLVIEEGVDGKKNLFIEGVFAQAEVKNRNGRIYEKHILDREVKLYNEEYIKTKRAFGELSHPSSGSINPDRVSHLITVLEARGNDYYGKARILDTTCGKTIKAIIEGGGVVGVSTRGTGTLREAKSANYVNEDYKMITTDAVLDPSAPSAFVQGIMEMKESVWTIDEEKVEKIYKQILITPKARLEEMQLKALEAMLKG